jgi:hypothetical protein
MYALCACSAPRDTRSLQFTLQNRLNLTKLGRISELRALSVRISTRIHCDLVRFIDKSNEKSARETCGQEIALAGGRVEQTFMRVRNSGRPEIQAALQE